MTPEQPKIVISGAAGLVGQNLVILLREAGFQHLVALDRHAANLAILAAQNPGVRTVCADMAVAGDWQAELAGASCLIQLHAQVTSSRADDFARNNVEATRQMLEACHHYQVPYLIHISSSVVHSLADDDYTRTKKQQEQLVLESGIPCCVLRPTLMFGWFDPKHFGWLSRFMAKTPVFPIPGNGTFLRQPLYNRDFCRVIMACLERRPVGKCYDIVGQEPTAYIDIIRQIRDLKKLRTLILPIPLKLFDVLLRIAAVVLRNPPFTADQLTALTAGDFFTGVDMQTEFGVTPTPLAVALEETFTQQPWCDVVIGR